MSYANFNSDVVPNDNSFNLTQDHRLNDRSETVNRFTKMQDSKLKQMFFSSENVNRIQKKIKKEIYIRTKKKYKLNVDQDEHTLFLRMLDVFKEKARHLPDNLVRQTKELNAEVVNYVAPDMITQIEQYYGYIEDINEPLKPIMRPMNVSSAGRKMGAALNTNIGLR